MSDKINRDDIDHIETLMGLMGKYSIDCIDIKGIKITKSVHFSQTIMDTTPTTTGTEPSDDEILFYST